MTEPWYSDGLRFECQRCGQCCSGAPGYVWIGTGEIAAMAVQLGITPAEFGKQYCRRVWLRISLLEKPGGDCVMLTPEGCGVYASRPMQCRTWPFWHDLVDTASHWEEVCEECPGANHGRLYTREETERISRNESEVD